MKIIVVMCTYNGADYLSNQIESIAAQTRLPDALIVCDDGSVDDTLPILRRFAAGASFPVHIVENPSRLGSTANFSQAIGLCDGDIIVLADQDDIWYPTKLQTFESIFTATTEVGAVFSEGSLIDEQGKTLNGSLWRSVGFGAAKQAAVRTGQGFNLLLRANFVTGATLAFRARFKTLLLPIPNGWVHDYWIAVLMTAESRLGLVDDTLIKYRCHATQQLGVKRTMADTWRHLLKGVDKQIYFDAAIRWTDVSERLRQHSNESAASSIIKCKALIAHMNIRGALPAHRLARWRYMLPEIINGNYFRYSLGMVSILRDLISH